jgi:hypothetical protein
MQVIVPVAVNDSTLLSSNVAEGDYPDFSISTEYAVGAYAIYVTTNTHWVIKSLVANNIGNYPTGLDTDTKWIRVSDTNRWKMFDLKHTSQTVNAGSISVTIASVSMTNALYLGNVDGASLSISAIDQYSNSIYNETLSLVDNSNVYDPWTYFFAPILYKTDVAITDLPPYAITEYTVTLSKPSGTVKCGTFILGQLNDFGNTDYGMKTGLLDYSVKRANEFGDYILTQRAYSKTLTIDVRVKKNMTDPFMGFIVRYRATPLVFIGHIDYAMTYVFGFFKDSRSVVDYPKHSLFSYEIEGLS